VQTNTLTTRIQVLSHQNTVFHELIKPVVRQDFEQLAKVHHVGQKFRAASRWDQFIAILMSQFSCRQSLRDIQFNLECQQEKLSHLGAKVAHKFRFKNPLYSLDASHIDLSLSLCEWAKVHDSKASMKLSIGLNHSNDIPEFVAVENGKENDMVQGRKFQFPAGSIVVFDKGYVDYQWYANLTAQNIGFVTRFRPKSVYQVIQQHPVLESKGILKDETIQLNSAHALKRKAPVLRRIEYRDQQSGKHFSFLSNNFHLAASTIAAIYKDRWKVELFFKAIKQNLKLKAFLGRSRNAIQTQIWIAMIAYLLVSFAQHLGKTGWTVQRLLRIIQVNLFERRTLKALFSPDKIPIKQEEAQMSFLL